MTPLVRRWTVLVRPSVRWPSADTAVLIGVLAVGVLAAAGQWFAYAGAPRDRWCSLSHDRNAHYTYALAMATELRNGRLGGFLAEFDAGSMVWPPLHGVLSAAAMVVGGPDPRLAVLPNVLGFVATIACAFALVRRLVPTGGTAAGLAAAGLLIASPAVRAYSTDVMIESIGLGLTLAALCAGVAWLQAPTRRSATALAAVLTGLYLLKYNYWLLFALTLGLATVATYPRPVFDTLLALGKAVPWRAWVGRQLRSPFVLIAGVLLGVAAYTAWTGGWQVTVGGKTVGMTTSRNVVNAAYALLLVRAVGGWLAHREAADRWFGPSARPLVLWHLIPAACWLLLPYRLRYFVWYMSPANAEKVYHDNLPDTIAFYWGGFAGEYVPAPAVAAGVAALAITVALAWAAGRLRPGAGLVVLFAGLAATLTMLHPNHKIRYIHSWSPVLFPLAAVGLAAVAGLLGRWPGRVVLGGGLAAAVGLAGVFGPRPGYAEERGLNGVVGSVRDLSDAYLPEVAADRGVLVVGNVITGPWAKWSYYERFGRTDGLAVDFRSVGWYAAVTPEVFDRWLATTTCTAVVFVDVPPGSPLYEPPTPAGTDALVEPLLARQTAFRPVKTIHVPDRGQVSVWRRAVD